MPEAIVLGSGTSNGVPMLGVSYSPRFLSNPKNHRTRASIALLGPCGNVLVDCPPEMRLQLTRERITSIDGVIVTHTHADHIMGMDDLRSFCMVQKRALPIYSLNESLEDIKRVFPYAFREYPKGIEVPRFDLNAIPNDIELGGLTIRFMTVLHGNLPVIALRVNDFAYVTDVSEIPSEAWDALQGLNTLILDGVRYLPHPNHFHFDKAIEIAQQLGAKTTYLTHLSHDYDHDEVDAKLPRGIRLAYDGLRIPI